MQDKRIIPTLNAAQNQYFHKNVKKNIYKLHENYKMLMKKHSDLCQQPAIGKHEELQIETASQNIALHAELLLEQIYDMKVHLMLLYQHHSLTTPVSELKRLYEETKVEQASSQSPN